MKYRAEIDGLRAVAVIPVILFHAGFELFKGGFVGVDVFFVISGYLITTIILTELERGKFSLIHFYERRMRRILPALFLVMFACLPLAWAWLLPRDMKDFSESLMAVPAFISNFLFWKEAGYFSPNAELKPLLHTWSLAVEEQYYLLFPLIMLAFWRMGKRNLLLLLGGLFFLSLYWAQWSSYEDPKAGFFLLHTRAWQLLLGVFAAFYLMKHDRLTMRSSVKEIGGWVGLVFIAYSIFLFSDATPFPGFYALVPTIGTVLIIVFATQETVIGKAIGNRAFVGIGLISYSAYLWHQPLFAFARHRSLVEPTAPVFLALSLLALILAYLSWRFVESPFRDKALIARRHVFLFAILGSAFFISVGWFGTKTNGEFWGRMDTEQVTALETRVQVNFGLSSACEGTFKNVTECQTDEEPEVLIWADSYGMHLVQGFTASNPDIKLIQKTVSRCGPVLDIAPFHPRNGRAWSERCLNINDQVLNYINITPSLKYVILSSPFVQFIENDARVLTREGEILSGGEVTLDAFLSTIERVKQSGKIPIIFSPPPKNGDNIGRCLVKADVFQRNNSACHVPLTESLDYTSSVYDFLRDVERQATVIWLEDGICEEGVCLAIQDDIFIYRDSGHLSLEGSAYIGKKMDFYGRLKQVEGRNYP